MAPGLAADLHLIYLDHRPFATCLDRHSGVLLLQRLLATHHSRRVHLLKA